MTTGYVKHPMRRRGAFMLADVVIGLIVLTLVAVIFTSAVGRQQKAARRLGAQREAVRIAEAVLTGLQTHAATPRGDDETTISIREMPSVRPSGRTKWAEVSVNHRGRVATLVGAVPASAATAPTMREVER
jgi:hypothetical protein